MRRLWLITVAVTLSAALAACLFACSEPPAVTVTVATAVPTVTDTPIPVPSQTPTPTPVPDTNGIFVPTFTPKISFVPLPTSVYTPNSRGNTLTPSPEWASPYPSPEGDPLVRIPESIKIARVKGNNVSVKKRSSLHGSGIGTVNAGELFRVIEESANFVCVDYNGVKGYFRPEKLSVSTLDLTRTETVRYRAASLNIHGAENSTKISRLASLIRSESLDVIGIQEVKRLNLKGNGIDWLHRLAEAAGYPYYVFCKTLDYDEGEYGTAILSRLPILFSDAWQLDVARGKEPRYLAYACLLTEAGPVHFFNTHLCASDMHLKSINIASMVYTLRAAGVRPFVVTGDFNCSPPRIYRYMKDISFVNIDMNTFGNGTRPKIIDNILYTDGIVAAGVHLVDTVETGVTDHRMVVSDFYVVGTPKN